MNTTPTYEAPEVIDSLDEADVMGDAPGTPTDVAGSGTPVHAV